MPQPRTVITVDALQDTAEKLLAVGTQLTEVALKLKQANMTEALLPWTNAHWRSVDKLLEVSLPMQAAILTEINAFKAGRKSTAAQEQERARRDYERKKIRMAEQSKGEVKRPRGRPRGS